MEKIDLDFQPEEIQDKMLELQGMNGDLYDSMLKDKNIFNIFI